MIGNLEKRETQLLLSFVKPHKAVSTSTISRWLVEILGLSGIDTSTFTGHSTRAASTSKAKILGVPTKEILKRGHWSKESTFRGHWSKESTFQIFYYKENTRKLLLLSECRFN